jgi:hypothetical protein
MHHDTWTAVMSFVAVALAALTMAPSAQAQARFSDEPAPSHFSPPVLLSALANYRSVRWASAAPVIHCEPAPLTERPGAQLELARPHVVPIEETFADAQSVKRAIAYRRRAVALDRR